MWGRALCPLLALGVVQTGCASVFGGDPLLIKKEWTQAVSVTCNAPGAQITVDGRPVGDTPEVSRKEDHTVRAEAPGYSSASMKLERSVKAGYVVLDCLFIPVCFLGIAALIHDFGSGAIYYLEPENIALKLTGRVDVVGEDAESTKTPSYGAAQAPPPEDASADRALRAKLARGKLRVDPYLSNKGWEVPFDDLGRPIGVLPREGGDALSVTKYTTNGANGELTIRGEQTTRVLQDPLTRRAVDMLVTDWIELAVHIDSATMRITGTQTWGIRNVSNVSGSVREIGPFSADLAGQLELHGLSANLPVTPETQHLGMLLHFSGEVGTGCSIVGSYRRVTVEVRRSATDASGIELVTTNKNGEPVAVQLRGKLAVGSSHVDVNQPKTALAPGEAVTDKVRIRAEDLGPGAKLDAEINEVVDFQPEAQPPPVQASSSAPGVAPSPAQNAALAPYDEIVRKSPNDPKAYSKRAGVKAGLKDFEGAVTDMTKAIELAKARGADADEVSVLYMGRGAFRTSADGWKGAIEDYTRAIETAPQNVIAYGLRYQARKGIDDSGAAADAEECLRLGGLGDEKGDEDKRAFIRRTLGRESRY